MGHSRSQMRLKSDPVKIRFALRLQPFTWANQIWLLRSALRILTGAMNRHNLSLQEQKPIAVSLFAGAGGCSLGFDQAGYQILFATDCNADAVSTYTRNFPATPCEKADVREISGRDILGRTNLEAAELDILVGGPPCQGFSSAGMKSSDDPRNSLLCHYVRFLECLRPKWFVMENVEGLLTNGEGAHVRDTVKAFLEIGYSVNLEKLYAQGYGIPQRRKRVFIVGNRLGFDFVFPQPVNNYSGHIFRKSEVTFQMAVGDLPRAADSDVCALEFSTEPENELQASLRSGQKTVSDHYAPPLSAIQFERVRALKQGQTMKDLPEHLQHESFRRRAFRRVMDGTPVEKRGGAPSGLKRLFRDEPALTITSAATREFVHPTEDRLLTIRECARLQTFPDAFEFTGDSSSRIQQIGNAVPPLLARIVAETIAKNYGFAKQRTPGSPSFYFNLTRAGGKSPALNATEAKLRALAGNATGKSDQLLFEVK